MTRKRHLALDRSLPYGANCRVCCQHFPRCQASHALKGNETVCVHEPSQFTPNELLGGCMAQSSWAAVAPLPSTARPAEEQRSA